MVICVPNCIPVIYLSIDRGTRSRDDDDEMHPNQKYVEVDHEYAIDDGSPRPSSSSGWKPDVLPWHQRPAMKRLLPILGIVVLLLLAYWVYSNWSRWYPNTVQGTFALGGDPAVQSSDSTGKNDKVVMDKADVDHLRAAAAGKPIVNTAQNPAPQQVQTQMQTGPKPPAGSMDTDTINPNPPNGMVFSGSGKYQLYRQGDITWRLDTDTGHTCIIYATLEQWNKPLVYSHGCGRT